MEITIKPFIFNLFQEATYVLYDDSRECVIIDAGCHSEQEKAELHQFIKDNNLIPKQLLQTHCHVDHILGNAFCAQTFGLKVAAHRDDAFLLAQAVQFGQMWGIDVEPSPPIGVELREGDMIQFGESALEVLHLPGHSPGHVGFYHRGQNILFTGDVLFKGSIGRTDLPGGNLDVLLKSIREKLLVLDEATDVYPGHGPQTTIGYEARSNPFL